jgi:hypothetical protein
MRMESGAPLTLAVVALKLTTGAAVCAIANVANMAARTNPAGGTALWRIIIIVIYPGLLILVGSPDSRQPFY